MASSKQSITMKRNYAYRFSLLLLCFAMHVVPLMGQSLSVDRVEPLNWWVGMKDPRLQILLHGADIADARVTIRYPGVQIDKVSKVENPNYLFIDLTIAPDCRAGTFDILLEKEMMIIVHFIKN